MIMVHLALTALLLFCFSVAYAKGPAKGVSISGVVRDQTGASIAGAEMHLIMAHAVRQSATTNQSGGFQFKLVPPGDYQVQITSPGFETTTIEVRLDGRPSPPLQVTLAIASLHQETTVTATSDQISTEAANNRDSVSMSEQSLSNLPIFDQDYVAAMSRFLDPGSVGTNGVSLVVNGMEVNNVGVSPSAIKEIKINQDPYAAEFQRPGRGRIEVITKPGSPEYHGTFNFIFRDAHLNARDPFALTRPPEQRRIYEGVLTGPVFGNKKSSFLVSASHREEDLQSVVYAQGVHGIIQANIAAPARTTQIAAQLDHSLSETNTISLRYSYLGESVVNQGVGGTVLPEAGFDSRNMEQEITFNQQTIFSPKLVNNFRLLLGAERQSNESLSRAQKIVVLDSFTGGGAQADYLRTEYHAQLMELVSYSSGRHLIKGGVNIPDLSRRGYDNNLNSLGTFYFSSGGDYNNQHPYSFTHQQGNGHIVFLEKVIGIFAQDEYHPRKNLMLTFGLRYDWQNFFHDNNNLAPRFSFAYSPGKSQRTVFRGGAGVFYDRSGARPIQDILLFNGTKLRQYTLVNPGYPDPLSGGGSLASQPVGITVLQPNVNIPFVLQYSFTVEQQLQKATSLAISYLGFQGFDQFRSRDINAPVAPAYSARPEPSIGVLRQIESAGRRSSNSLEVTLRGKVTRYFNGMVQYRLSSSHDDTSGINYFPPNAYDLTGEWGRSDFDRRHRFELLGTLNPGKLFNLGVSVSVYSGQPYTLTTGLDPFHTGTANARPGGIPRNSLQGPAYAELALRWSRDFQLIRSKKKDGGLKGTFAIDAFNVLNKVNYSYFVGNLSSPFFGRAVSAQPPRRLQLSFRLKF